MFFRFESTLGVPLASLGSRAAGVPSSLRSDRFAPLRPLTRTSGAACCEQAARVRACRSPLASKFHTFAWSWRNQLSLT
jgi:hypothetical protein